MKVDFQEIKASTDLVRVVESYGIALKKAGQDHVGLCPFHEDRTPSLRVTQAKGLFRCPACDASGNVIQFVARMESLTEREAALKLLCAVPGVMRASQLVAPPKPEPPPVTVDESTRAKLLERVTSFYARTLYKDRAGLEYLKGRGLQDAALLESFQVGYCNGSMREALPKSGEVIEQLKALGVLNEKGNEVFYGRVTVPIFDTAGKIAGLYGRRVNDGEPRHIYLRGTQNGVFNWQAAKASRSLILVEAILDAMSLWAAGNHNTIALYGKDGWTAHHERLVKENGVREIYLALDNDERGKAAAEGLKEKLSGLVESVYVVQWPEGVKDANAFFSSRSATDFALLMEAANPSLKQKQAGDGGQLGKEAVEAQADGFIVSFGDGDKLRRYELCAVEKPSASRLKATVKAVSTSGGTPRFSIDTVDFYLLRSKRGFISEVARLFRETAETIEGDINRLTEHAEAYLKKRLEEREPTPEPLSDAERAEGVRLGRSPGLMSEIQRDFDRLGIIGETSNRLLLYLAMTSRKMEGPLAVQILSSSGAGKSHLQDSVLSLCPEEDLIKLTSLTDRALFYKGEDSLRHKAIAIAEVAGAEGARYALRNLISEKKLVIESTVKNPQTGRLETQINTVYGPTAVFETTTQPDTDPETKSRYLLLSVDESPEQTRAIVAAQRQSHTLEGRKCKRLRETIIARHHAFQRLLRPLVVVNPFEPLLGASDDPGEGRLTQRRDHPKYLNLILAVTFLHQLQKPVKHDAELGDYIETTLEDIAIAHELAATLFGSNLEDLSFPGRELLRLTGEYVAAQAKEAGKPALEIEWTRRELREAIHWTEARLRLHLAELVRLEYLAPVGGRFGSRYRYRLLVAPEQIAEGGRLVVGWKSVEQLRHEANLAGIGSNLARGNANLASTSQPQTCEVEPAAKPHEIKLPVETAPHLASINGKRHYVLNGHGVGGRGARL
jgi:DNA primase catalytic core